MQYSVVLKPLSRQSFQNSFQSNNTLAVFSKRRTAVDLTAKRHLMFGRIRSEVIRGDVGKGHWIPDKYRITTLLTERQRSLSERREYTLVESLRKFPPAAVEPQRRTKRGVLVTVYIHTSPSSGTHARLQQNLHGLFVQYRPQPSRFLL